MTSINFTQIDPDIALKNFELLLHMRGNHKLIVNEETDKLIEDLRWLPGIRRHISGDNREQIYEPIKKSLNYVYRNNKVDQNQYNDCIKNMRNVFCKLYPNYEKLHKLFDRLDSEFYRKGLPINFSPYNYMVSYGDLEKAYSHFSQKKRDDALMKHYLCYGIHECRMALPNFFDPKNYLKLHPEILENCNDNVNKDSIACRHYIEIGWKKGYKFI
jgi:hypothetical protein